MEDRRRYIAAIASLIVGITLLGVKFWAYHLTHSQAVLSDAVESIVNVVAALLALIGIIFAARPADEGHPYGHGKIEYFSAAFEGGMIFTAAAIILFESIRALWRHQYPHAELTVGAALLAGSGLVNLLLGIYLVRVGNRVQSMALKASGHHVISDFWTSAAVVGGLVLMILTRLPWLDAVLAAFVGLHLGYTGYQLVRESIGGLLDEEDLSALKALSQAFEQNLFPGIIQIHHTRVIRSGRYHHIDVHVVVPEFWSVADAHRRLQEFEKRVIADYQAEGELHMHVDPCRRAYCRNCDYEPCPIRKNAFEGRTSLSLEELRKPTEPAEPSK